MIIKDNDVLETQDIETDEEVEEEVCDACVIHYSKDSK